MEKFIKSIFSSSTPDKKKSLRDQHDVEKREVEFDNPIGDRRKLSMSRSGRLKHSNKKRHSLTLDLYGQEDDLKQKEKPKSKEYHVNAPIEVKSDRKKSIDAIATNGAKSPEEEIDSAFEIIDKS